MTVYKAWVNDYPGYTIPDYDGIAEDKFILSVLASPDAGDSTYYYTTE